MDAFTKHLESSLSAFLTDTNDEEFAEALIEAGLYEYADAPNLVGICERLNAVKPVERRYRGYQQFFLANEGYISRKC